MHIKLASCVFLQEKGGSSKSSYKKTHCPQKLTKSKVNQLKVHIIANPIAGGGRGKILAEGLEKALQDRQIDTILTFTQQAGDGEKTAAQVHADYVAVVGGDGTVNEIINGLGDNPAAVAIMQAGSANVVARELKLPKNPEGLAQLIADGRVRDMDAGLRDGRRFLLGAGAGLDAAVTEVMKAGRGKKSSVWRWVLPTIKTVFQYTFPPIKITVDGKVVSETSQYAIVGNCRYSAGVLPATPKAEIDDGLLDVCLMHKLNPFKLLWLLLMIWTPGFTKRKDVVYVQGTNVRFEAASEERVPLQVDGDPGGEVPAEFTIEPKAIRVVTPLAEYGIAPKPLRVVTPLAGE